MRTIRSVLAAATLSLSLACSSDDGPPTQPPPAAAATVTVTASTTGAFVSLGDTRTLTAVARDANQGVLANAPVTWSTSSAAVATISATSGATITVTSAGNGTATITATSGTANGTAPITVTQTFTAVTVAPDAVTLNVAGTRQLVATGKDARGVAIPGLAGATFASSDPAKATVSATGLVTGVAEGAATITTTLASGGVTRTAQTPVTVVILPPTATVVAEAAANAFSPPSVTIARAGTVTWTFGARPHNVQFGGTAGAPTAIPVTTGAAVARTFNTAGTFAYDCTLHPGMSGTVIVQ